MQEISYVNTQNRLAFSQTTKLTNPMGDKDPALAKAAQEFEAAFLTHMLKFSGLGDALTLGGGKEVEAFTDFYIEAFADEIAASGKLGLAERFYDKLSATHLRNGEMRNETF